MSKNKFEKGLQKAAEALEARVNANGFAFFDCIEEAEQRGVDPEVVLAERAAKAAAELYRSVMENMNPQQWA